MVQVVSPFSAIQYDNAAQTRESYFTDCSFLPGDLGELSGDGLLILRGRRRGFINVGGNKVDPAEVEAALLGIPGVVEAVVLGVPDPPADEKIKAVLVAAAGVSQSMLRLECATRLPEFKRPKVIELRHELPRSPLGKVLRKCLLDEGNQSK
jgi:long-chain acyl-CoA synthetase